MLVTKIYNAKIYFYQASAHVEGDFEGDLEGELEGDVERIKRELKNGF